ncbi:hypothetical protein PRIPAC_73317, partial [Pristionchus pacificus]
FFFTDWFLQFRRIISSYFVDLTSTVKEESEKKVAEFHSMSESTQNPDASSVQKEDEYEPRKGKKYIIIAGFVTILLLLLVAFFFIGYLSAPKEERNENESESDTSKVKNDNKPEVMSCEWMKECTRKRKGTPPLLIISFDGFAQSYLKEKETPTVLKMGECGGRAEALVPTFPSRTFPNH